MQIYNWWSAWRTYWHKCQGMSGEEIRRNSRWWENSVEHWALVKHAVISGIGGNKFSLFHWINIVPCPSLLLLLLPLSLNCTVWWLREQRVFSPAGSAAGEEQPIADPVSLWFDDSLQRTADIIHDVQQYFQSTLLCHCYQRVSLASCQPQSQPTFASLPSPAWRNPFWVYHPSSTPPRKRSSWQPLTGRTSTGVSCRCLRSAAFSENTVCSDLLVQVQICVARPVQFVVYPHHKVLAVSYDLNLLSLYRNQSMTWSRLPRLQQGPWSLRCWAVGGYSDTRQQNLSPDSFTHLLCTHLLLIHPMIAVSSSHFWTWHISEVYRVKRRGASTVPYGAPVLLSPSAWHTVVSQWGSCLSRSPGRGPLQSVQVFSGT